LPGAAAAGLVIGLIDRVGITRASATEVTVGLSGQPASRDLDMQPRGCLFSTQPEGWVFGMDEMEEVPSSTWANLVTTVRLGRRSGTT
jgi:hypothetical protein